MFRSRDRVQGSRTVGILEERSHQVRLVAAASLATMPRDPGGVDREILLSSLGE
jgi:hypothetical protein